MSKAPTEAPAPVRGVIAVIEEDGRLLVIRRAAGIPAGGSWCFPGGGIEPGETPPQALIREVWEEVGLEVQPLREVWEWQRPDGGLFLTWWTARRMDRRAEPRLCSAEVAELRWATPYEVRELDPLLPSNREFLDRVWAHHCITKP